MSRSGTDGSSSKTLREFPWLAVLVAMAIASALRLPGLLQDPWIDEIWSWGLARSRASALDIFSIRTSNNHTLNTLWIWLVGDRPDFILYRLPAFVAGVACVPLAATIAARAGRNAALAAAAIMTIAYLPIVYASEARGYSMMLFASLATLESAWRWIEGRGARWLAASWICAAVGLFSLSLFVVGWAAMAIGLCARILGERESRPSARIALFVGPPIALFVAWWFMNVRHVFNSGAPPWKLVGILGDTAVAAFGLPSSGWAIVLGALLALAILLVDVFHLAARRDRAWMVQLGVVVLAPIATVAWLSDEYLAPRYFLVPIAFWCLSFARVLGRIADVGRAGTLHAVTLFALFAMGNAVLVVPFAEVGRGTIGALVRRMAESSSVNPIVITSNYDFNVGALIEWHARSLPRGRSMRYVPQKELGPSGADYVVFDQPRFESDPPASIRAGSTLYQLFAITRREGPCGTDWAVYERSAR